MCVKWWSFVSRVAPHLTFSSFLGLVFKFKPSLELLVVKLDNSTSSSLSLNLKINPKQVGATLETKLHHLRHM